MTGLRDLHPRNGWVRCILYVIQFACAVVAAIGIVVLLAESH